MYCYDHANDTIWMTFYFLNFNFHALQLLIKLTFLWLYQYAHKLSLKFHCEWKLWNRDTRTLWYCNKWQKCCRPLKYEIVLLLPGEIFLEDICRLSAADIYCPQTYMWHLQFPKFQDVQYKYIKWSIIKFFKKKFGWYKRIITIK